MLFITEYKVYNERKMNCPGGNYGITEIEIGANISQIGNYAFANC